MIISLAGMPGSGKSSVSKILSKKLGYKHYSAGDFRRQMAKKKGISLAELNKIGEKEIFTDKQVDDFQKELGKHEDNFVIDGRLSWYFIKNSVRIFLDAKPGVRAQRIFQDGRKEEKFATIEEAKKAIAERVKSDKKRYKKYYGLDSYDKKNFHFVIDTTKISAEQVADEIIKLTKNVKERPSAGTIVVNNKKEYLLLYKTKEKFWEFPKGSIQKNETENGAMKRELLEETGIKTYELFKNFKEYIEYSFKVKQEVTIMKITFFLVGTTDEIKISGEHSKYKWVGYEDAMKILKYDFLKEPLQKAESHLQAYIEDKNKVWMKR